MKLTFKRMAIILVLLVLLGGGGLFILQKQKDQSLAPAASYASMTKGNIENIVTSQGTLEPKEYVDVGAQVSGQLEKLYVEIGDQVKLGDQIAEIDAQVFESQVAGDEARLKTMQAQKLQTEAEIRQAEQKLARNKKLIDTKAISEEVYEDSLTALDILKAQLMSLEAQIEEAQSTLDGNKANLAYTKIYAPMSGTVVSLSAKEGQTLNANQTTPVIVQIANLDIMTVKAQVAEADINKINQGMPVYFTTLGSQDRRWQGKVRQVLPTPEILNDVVLYNVLVDVENDDGKLMSGMTTQIFFVLDKAENVNVIPAAALMRKAQGKQEGQGVSYLVRVKEGAGVIEKIVVIGLSDRTNAQVLSGLDAGDQVLIPAAVIENKPSNNTRQRMPRL